MATLTIRNLDEAIKRRIRIAAAEHGRSMEAEAREILASAVALTSNQTAQTDTAPLQQLTGIWQTRSTTDELMHATRSDD